MDGFPAAMVTEIIAGLIIAGLLGLAGGLRKRAFRWWAKRRQARQNQETEDVVPSVVQTLKPYADDGLANVKIVIWSNAHRRMADRVASTFQLAGWDTNYNKTAQESRNPQYRDGIEVRGFNEQLINVAATSVSRLGGWDVRTQLDTLAVNAENPKFPKVQKSVYVTIGYPK